ncbi:MAG: efflux RND transporter periplasmic adaptor subunit [Candidatus Niameybacter stercoravium]|nr:efflux RND transporter periplasmic adaptor subunit [Candidatus Niameybacter stercoravium]
MKIKKKLVVAIGATLIVLVMGMSLLGGQNKGPVLIGDPQGQLVNVDKAIETDIQTKISATGMVTADKKETVLADLNTQVEKINVEVGDLVKKGDVLLTYKQETKENLERDLEKLDLQIESSKILLNQMQNASKQSVMGAETAVANAEKNILDLEDSIKSIETSLEISKKSLEKAQNNYDVTKQLHSEGLAAKTELDDAEQALMNAKDQVNSLETKIQSTKKSLETAKMQQESAQYDLDVLLNKVQDQTKLENIAVKQNEIASLTLQKQALLEQLEKATVNVIAPMDGVVSEVKVQDGSYVAPGAELVKIINPDQLVVKAEISPYYAAQLETGLKVAVKYNGSTTVETEGTVSMVSPVAVQKSAQDKSATSTAIPVEVALDSSKGLKEGLTVDLKIITSDVKDVIAVPLLATMTDKEDNNYLFVVGADGKLSKRMVKQGAADNQYVQVSDLEVGDIVVTNPTEALEDGMSVRYLPFEEAGEQNDSN